MSGPSWPADSFQSYLGPLWEDTPGAPTLDKGRLIKGFFCHVDQKPRRLVVEGRGADDTSHAQASYRVEPFDIKNYKVPDALPVAAMPLLDREEFVAFRAKVRLLLVVQPKGRDVPADQKTGGSAAHSRPTILVAPYYGVEFDGKRAGWDSRLIERIRRGEYPQYMWDILPGQREPSVLRLDHIGPISRWQPSFIITKHRLSTEGINLLDEWLNWSFFGKVNPDGTIYYLSNQLRDYRS